MPFNPPPSDRQIEVRCWKCKTAVTGHSALKLSDGDIPFGRRCSYCDAIPVSTEHRHPRLSRIAQNACGPRRATPELRQVVFGCGVCDRMRFKLDDMAEAIGRVSGRPSPCGFCSDGCFK